VPQIPKLATSNAKRLVNVREVLWLCGDLPGLTPLALPTDKTTIPVFYKLPWLLTGNNNDCDSPEFEQVRRRLIAAIQAEGVAMDEGFRGFARRTGHRCRSIGELPHARRAAAGTLLLHHPVLLEPADTIARVAGTITKVARHLLPR
jgi:perosamine synthetase